MQSSSSKKKKVSIQNKGPPSIIEEVQNPRRDNPFTNKAILQMEETHNMKTVRTRKCHGESKNKSINLKTTPRLIERPNKGKVKDSTLADIKNHSFSLRKRDTIESVCNGSESDSNRSFIKYNLTQGHCSRRRDSKLHSECKYPDSQAEKAAFISTQEKQIQHLLKKVRSLKRQNQFLRQENTRSQAETICRDSVNERTTNEKVMTLEDCLQELRGNVEIISLEKDQLTGKHRNLCEDNQILRKDHQILLCQHSKLIKEHQECIDRLRIAQAQLQNQQNSNLKNSASLKSAEEGLRNLQKEYQHIINQLEARVNKAQNQLAMTQSKANQTLKKYHQVQGELSELTQKNQQLRVGNQNNENSFTREQQIYKRRIHETEELIQIQRERIDLYQKAQIKSQNLISELKDQMKAIKNDQKNKHSSDLDAEVNRNLQLQGQISQLENQLKYFHQKYQGLATSKVQLQDEVTRLDQQLAQKQQRLSFVEQQYLTFQKQYQVQIQALGKAKITAQREIEQLSKKLDSEANRVKQLQIQCKNHQTYIQQSKVLFQRQNNKIPSLVDGFRKQNRKKCAKKNEIRQKDSSQGTVSSEEDRQIKIVYKNNFSPKKRHTKVELFSQQHKNECYVDDEAYRAREKVIWQKLTFLDNQVTKAKQTKSELQSLLAEKQSLITNLKEKINYSEQKTQQLEVKLTYSEQKIQQLEAKLKNAHQQISVSKQFVEELKKRQETLEQETRKWRENITTLEHESKKLKQNVTTLEQVNRKLKETVITLEQQSRKLRVNIIALNKQSEQESKKMSEKNRSLGQAQQKIQQLKKQLAVKTSENSIELLKSGQCLESNLLKAELNIKRFEMTIQNLNNTIRTKDNRIAELIVVLKDKQTLILETRDIVQDMKWNLKQKTQEIDMKEQQLKQCKMANQNQIQQIEKLKDKNHILHIQICSSAKNLEEKEKSLKSVAKRLANLQKGFQEKSRLLEQAIGSLRQTERELTSLQQEKALLENNLRQLRDHKHSCQKEDQLIHNQLLRIESQSCSLKQNLQKQEQFNNSLRRELQRTKWELGITRNENENLRNLMTEELAKRKTIIQELVNEKRKLYDQINRK